MAKFGKALGSFAIDLKLDDSAFQQSMSGIKKQSRYWAQEMKTQMRLADQYGTKEDKLAAKKSGLTNVIEAQRKELDKLKKRYEESYDETGKATAKTLDYAREVRKAEQNLSNYEIQLEGVSKELKEFQRQQELSKRKLVVFGDDMIKVGAKLEKTGEKMSKIGSSLTKAFTVPLTLGVGFAVKAAADYEDAFAGVRKTVEGTEKQFKRLSDEFRSISKEIPVSASELANLGEVAGQLGIETDNIDEFVRVIADLGVATNLAGEEGASQLAKFANVMNMSQKDFDRLGSALVDLGNHYATTEADIMAMASRLAGAGAQIGLSEADVLGLSTALSSVGIEAEMGGSAFSKIMVNMQVASKVGLNQMKELSEKTGLTRRELELMKSNDGKAFKELASSLNMTTNEMTNIMKASKNLEGFASIAGMTGEQFKQAFEKDAVGAIGAFIGGLGDAEDKGSSAIELLDEMGIREVRLRDSLLRAANATDMFSGAVKTSNEAWGDNTALTNEAEEKYKTFNSQLQIFKNKLQDIAIEFGGPFMEALNSVMDASKPLLDTFKNLAQSFTDLPKKTQQNIVKFTGLAIAAGPLLKIFGGLTSSVGGVFKSFGKGAKTFDKFKLAVKAAGGLLPWLSGALAAVNWPLVLIVGGITAVGVSIFLLRDKIKPFAKYLGELFEKLKDFSLKIYDEYVGPALDKVGQAFKVVVNVIRSAFKIIGEILSPGLQVISGVFSFAFSDIINISEKSFGKISEVFDNSIKKLNETAKNLFSGAKEAFAKVWKSFVKFVQPAIDEVIKTFKSAFKSVIDFWKENGAQFFEAVINFLKITFGAIAVLISGVFIGAYKFIKTILTAVFEFIKWIFGLIRSFLQEYGEDIINGFKDLFNFLWAIIQPALSLFTLVLKTTFSTIVNLVKVSWDLVKGLFSGAFKVIGGLIKIFTGVFTGDWEKMWDGVKDVAKGSWNIIATGFEAFVNAFLSVAEGLSNGITKGIVGAVNGVIKAVSWILDKFGLDKLKEWEVGEIKIKRVTLPKFAKGSGGLLMDTLGVVNDQKGSNYREMIIPPKGEPFIPRGRDVVLPMQKGTQIVPANITKEFTDSLPHFKKGTGGLFRNVWEGTKNTVGKLWGKVKDFTGNIMDYFDKPKELVQYAVNKFTNIPELPSFWLDMAHGAVKHTSSKAVGFVKSKFDDFMSSSNFIGDDSIGSNGVYNYLMDIARSLMRKYNMVFTSGFRPGDPYDHGKGLAVDIALPGVVNGSPIYQAAAEDAIRMPGVKYVITNGKWKHKGKSWVPWPDGDHYDHVHISGEKPVKQMASQALGGSWAAQIKRAAAVMGQSVTPSEIAGIQAQIQRESGGNQRIVQSSAVWDVNMASGNPAKGLLQYVPSTFNNYKVRGYEDIFNGFHQLLAFFNNSNWRRDLPYGRSGWGPSGSRIKPYANGGLVNRHQLAEIAEGNKPEMIIPLTKKTRAVELINKAKAIIGMENGSVVVNNDTERLEALVAKQADMVESMSEKMIALLEIIAQKELTIDDESFNRHVNGGQGMLLKKNLVRG